MSHQRIRLYFGGVRKTEFLNYLFLGHGLKLFAVDKDSGHNEQIELRSLDNHNVDVMDLKHEFEAFFDWKGKSEKGNFSISVSGRGPFDGFVNVRISDR